MLLSKSHCKPGATKLGHEKMQEHLDELDVWNLSNDFNCLQKTYTFSNFSKALSFTNKIGDLAEQENHHPDIYLSWGKVVVKLTTHDCGGLSLNDFILASKIDRME